jgi:hypothetical protein
MSRPTFDMSVLRVALDPARPGHEEALRLPELAAEGRLEIAVPPQGVRADFRGDMTTAQARRVAALLASDGVVELRQLAIPSGVTFPSDHLFPEKPVDGFAEAWATVEADWNGPGTRPGEKDRWYVQSHVARGRDVLVTDDPGMRTMCRRLGEYGFDVTAERLIEYAARYPKD